MARKLGSGPDIEGKVIIVPTPLQMAKLLEEKKIDFYMESPYPTYLINKQGAAVLLLRRWKSGMAEYRSLIFSKKESETNRLEQLRGKMIAFEDPGSTSGYFLPKVLLLKKGFKLYGKTQTRREGWSERDRLHLRLHRCQCREFSSFEPGCRRRL